MAIKMNQAFDPERLLKAIHTYRTCDLEALSVEEIKSQFTGFVNIFEQTMGNLTQMQNQANQDQMAQSRIAQIQSMEPKIIPSKYILGTCLCQCLLYSTPFSLNTDNVHSVKSVLLGIIFECCLP